MTSFAPAPAPVQLLDAMLRMAPLDVLLFDHDLICRYAVLADETLFGRTAGQFIGEPADALFPPARDDLRAALKLAVSGSGASYEYPAYRYTSPTPTAPVKRPSAGRCGWNLSPYRTIGAATNSGACLSPLRTCST